MRIVIRLFLFIGIPVSCLSQPKTDSLRDLLRKAETKRDIPSITYYNSYLGYQFFNEKHYDSALHFYYRVLARKDVITNSPLLASTLNGIGASYGETGFPDSALSYYHEALRLFVLLNDSASALETRANMVITYKDLGLYDKALADALDLLTILEDGLPNRRLASCYSSVAFIYEKTGDLKKALEYHNKALDIRKKIKSKKGEGLSYNSIGETYTALGLYDSALRNLNRSLTIKNEQGDRNGSSSTLNNIGEALIYTGNLLEAEEHLNESLKIKRDFNDRADMVVTLNNLAKVKLAQNKLKDAERLLLEGENLARETQSLENLRENLELSIRVQKAKGDIQKVIKLADELLLIRDSLLNVEKARSIRAVAIEYETEKVEQKLLLLEEKDKVSQAEIKTRQTQVRALIAGTILLMILAAIIYHYFRMVRRNKAKVDTLLKELHHRVKNNLQMLSSILSLQAQKLTDESAIQVVKSNEGRINAMALIHKKLYKDDKDRNINIKEYITELIQYLVYAYGYNETGMKLNLSIEDIQLDVDKAIPLGLVLNEIISNAFKHAYAHEDNPELLVSLRHHSNSDIQIQIADNGSGIGPDVGKSPDAKFGVTMVNRLIKELKGSYEVNCDTGTKYTLHIPLV